MTTEEKQIAIAACKRRTVRQLRDELVKCKSRDYQDILLYELRKRIQESTDESI